MFKLAILSAILAIATAFPGGLTGIVLNHDLGPIHTPQVISHGHVSHPHIIAQPIAPVVHSAPIVTRTFLPSHGHVLGHGLHGLHG
ncbi:uncharacterized protein LOC127279186 [Leptopilina boulardi]|uniref:uncharacterized protein LOC127279186 n=1 Tax=Leptopilina boulardi TaxID=63433 RepID=UPI0021F5CC54|nr:uncharacterized protein LOC127279186 [Leptopilina boulardi]